VFLIPRLDRVVKNQEIPRSGGTKGCGNAHAKTKGIQFRFANLARQLSERGVEAERTQALASLESLLESSRLAREDYFYRAPRNDRERQWLFENRSDAARHLNLLSDLRPEHLQYVA
jgi:hypothetical protein